MAQKQQGNTVTFYVSWALSYLPCFLLNSNNFWFCLIMVIYVEYIIISSSRIVWG